MERTELIYEITHCGEFLKAVKDSFHPCHTVVSSQKEFFSDVQRFHVPEPWNGNIETADILFISSNPSIDPNEEGYPSVDSTIPEGYFDNRFSNTPRKSYSHYWRTLEKWTSWLLGTSESDLLQSRVAITELVHCKSQREIGVAESCQFCVEKWLEKVVSLFHGKYIVLVGKSYAWQYQDKVEKLSKGIPVLLSYAPSPVKGMTDEVRKQMFTNQLASR